MGLGTGFGRRKTEICQALGMLSWIEFNAKAAVKGLTDWGSGMKRSKPGKRSELMLTYCREKDQNPPGAGRWGSRRFK
ncbi:hypothetical protein D3H55_05905 [Bacillus salacetis]|uniref:Uncharacterized protein n=1 Tax=Bacillus salacetis TaxID=2315464 RepID=A0A3A1R822_9BACI|nr:hypothetical protein [Bacillus salacetis]RIW36439.1 hypothetical protein D3H55_05905 [Bacillus salacetis]